MSSHIAILGNCQAQMLESIIAASTPDILIDRLPPSYQMDDSMYASIMPVLKKADVVFAQRMAPDYKVAWLRGVSLKETIGTRLHVWPNIYFDGYTPGVRYIYLDGWGKLQGPLEDYHLPEIINAFQAGLSVADAAQRLCSTECIAGTAPFAVSLDVLRARETEADIPISDFLQGVIKDRRCVYTPNHPYHFVLVEMARRLACVGDFRFDAANALDTFSPRLDRIYIPTGPSIAKLYHLNFDRILLFRGIDVVDVRPVQIKLGSGRSYSPEELVEQFYKVYEIAFAGSSVASN